MPIAGEDLDDLQTFDKEEWWDILQEAIRRKGGRPIPRAEFDRNWEEFQDAKAERAKRRSMN